MNIKKVKIYIKEEDNNQKIYKEMIDLGKFIEKKEKRDIDS
jgi:hypothetical protein